jgi:hypothetical protein
MKCTVTQIIGGKWVGMLWRKNELLAKSVSRDKTKAIDRLKKDLIQLYTDGRAAIRAIDEEVEG